jgi:hypothetical protein
MEHGDSIKINEYEICVTHPASPLICQYFSHWQEKSKTKEAELYRFIR